MPYLFLYLKKNGVAMFDHEKRNFRGALKYLSENQDLHNGSPIHVMIDIETLSLDDNATVFSFGYALFDKQGYVPVPCKGKITMNPDTSSGVTDEATVSWHNSNPVLEKNLKEAYTSPLSEKEFCVLIKKFLTALWTHKGSSEPEFKTSRGQKIPQLWAMGPQFDLVILKNMFRRNGVEWPVVFYAERDLRTLLELVRDDTAIDLRKFIHNHEPHCAESDAVAQANMAVFAMNSGILSGKQKSSKRREWERWGWLLPENFATALKELSKSDSDSRMMLYSFCCREREFEEYLASMVNREASCEEVVSVCIGALASATHSMNTLWPFIQFALERKPELRA